MLYHEKQVAALCGVHCLNTLLQGPYFTEWDLAEIAHELDALEKQCMAEGGIHTDDYRMFMAEGSSNVSSDGMFSSQVLDKALANWNLTAIPLDHPDMRTAAAAPAQQAAYICHLQAHWFTVRPVNGSWWNFNSLFPAPQPLSLTYLDAFLNTLKAEGWTIFVVRGELPRMGASLSEGGSGAGRFWTPEEARKANVEAEEAQKAGRTRKVWEDALSLAGQGRTVRLRGSNAAGSTPMAADEEAQLQQAYLASLQDAPITIDDDDADLAAAIAASLGDVSAKRHCFKPDASAPSTSRPPAPEAGSAPASLPKPEATPCDNQTHQPEHTAASNGMIGVGEVDARSRQAAGAPSALPEEPEPAEGVCCLSVRLPSNAQCQRRFTLQAPLADVWAWLSHEGWDMQRHQLCLPYPRKVLSDGSSSLSQAGISRRERLMLEAR